MKCSDLAAVAALAFVLGSGSMPVFAAPCAGFTDVQDTDSFCDATQWLKNRQITLGCGAGTTYCPGDVVTRASMALFMKRLGIAITPKLVALDNDMTASATGPGQFTPFCQTATLPAVNYPQTVRAHGSISVPAAGPALHLFLVATLNSAPT